MTKGVHCSKIQNRSQNDSGGHSIGQKLGHLDAYKNPVELYTYCAFRSGSQENDEEFGNLLPQNATETSVD